MPCRFVEPALILFTVAGLSPSLATAGVGEARPWDRLLSSCRCAREVSALLGRWDASGEILRAAPGIDGGERFHLATHRLGTWITLKPAAPAGSPSLFRTDPERSERVALTEDCRAEILPMRTPRVSAAGDGFTDRDLASALSRTHRLVVFLWSPHMPLSVDGLREIEEATRVTGIGLIAVTDPSSDPRFVDEVSREQGIPPESRRPVASLELLFRDLTVHAPTVLAFDGKKVSAPLPGYRNRHDYVRFLRGFFSSGNQSPPSSN